jgi:succinate-acetate transporter protein
MNVHSGQNAKIWSEARIHPNRQRPILAGKLAPYRDATNEGEQSLMQKDLTRVEIAGFESLTPADPGPLGLNCFALTTFLLSLVNAGFIPAKLAGHVWLTSGFVFGGAAQIMAGLWEFKTRNVFGATAFISYGGFWISLALIPTFVTTGLIPDKDITLLLAWFLTAWTIFTFYMWLGSFRTNKALLTTFTLLLITFILLDIGHFGNSSWWNRAGGIVGLATAFSAWYTSAAGILNPVYGKVILPVGPAKK